MVPIVLYESFLAGMTLVGRLADSECDQPRQDPASVTSHRARSSRSLGPWFVGN